MEIRPLALVMRRNRGSLSAHRGALECHRDKYTNTQIHNDKYTNTHIHIQYIYTSRDRGLLENLWQRDKTLQKENSTFNNAS